MNEISGFGKVAAYLTHPLVLVGFVMMLVFGIHKQLLKSGVLQPLSKKESGAVVKLMLKYGFVLGLIIMLIGLALQLLS